MGWSWSDVQVSPTDPNSSSADSLHKENETHISEADRKYGQAAPTRNPIIFPAKHQTRTNNNPLSSQPNKRQKRNPIHFMELTDIPLPHYLILQSLCNQVIMRQPKYGIINIAPRLFLAMSRPVTQFSSMITVLDWQQISKPKGNTNATSQAQYKFQLQPVTIGKWALPCLFQSTGLKAAKTEPFPRSQKVDNCCQIWWSPVSQEHPEREENYDYMPQCDTCQRTYHWKCLTDLNACSHTARQAAENSEDWHSPACTDLTQAEMDTRKSYGKSRW